MASSGIRRRHGCYVPDHPQSMRDYVRMFGLPPFWATFGEMEQSVRTGLSVGDKVTPGGLWAYFAQHPEANAIFNATMVAKAHAQIAGVLAAYDFSPFKLIGDIGGGRGHLLSALLEQRADCKGRVVRSATRHWGRERRGVAPAYTAGRRLLQGRPAGLRRLSGHGGHPRLERRRVASQSSKRSAGRRHRTRRSW